MSKVWFTSDTHFGHGRIIAHCNRPFSSAAEMDSVMIVNWNSIEMPDDIVWHLGDFCWSKHDPEKLLGRLNGIKHLVHGNHDDEETRSASGWASSQPMAETMVDGQRIVLCHYAMRVWNRSHRGALQLYGHNHGRLPGNRQSLDVGVDCWDFRPIGLREIMITMKTLTERLEVHP